MNKQNKLPPSCIHPTLAAKLIHETIGHLAEAESILRATAKNAPWYKMPRISPKITVIDFATEAFGKPVPLPMYTDDEGTPTRDVTVIKGGQIQDIMTSVDTAAKLNLPLTGNARKDDPEDIPLARMRNTALLPGTDCPEAMLASLDTGFYLVDSELDLSDHITGEFVSIISEGYLVQDGKIAQRLPPCFITGEVSDFMQSITMVGNDFAWITDTCDIEGQVLDIAAGAPTILATLDFRSCR